MAEMRAAGSGELWGEALRGRQSRKASRLGGTEDLRLGKGQIGYTERSGREKSLNGKWEQDLRRGGGEHGATEV